MLLYLLATTGAANASYVSNLRIAAFFLYLAVYKICAADIKCELALFDSASLCCFCDKCKVSQLKVTGESYRTQFLVPYQEIPKEYQTLTQSGDIYVDHCKKGYQTTQTFEVYLRNILLPQLFERRKSAHPSQQTIIFLVDGHTSRGNPSLLKYCDENNVIIICLPSHTSHRLQPLDCGPNGLLKRKLSVYITDNIRLFSQKSSEQITDMASIIHPDSLIIPNLLIVSDLAQLFIVLLLTYAILEAANYLTLPSPLFRTPHRW